MSREGHHRLHLDSVGGTLSGLSTEVTTTLDSKLLELLVCPVTKASLTYQKDKNELWCRASGLAYPIRDGIPVMLEDEARELSATEMEQLRG